MLLKTALSSKDELEKVLLSAIDKNSQKGSIELGIHDVDSSIQTTIQTTAMLFDLMLLESGGKMVFGTTVYIRMSSILMLVSSWVNHRFLRTGETRSILESAKALMEYTSIVPEELATI